MGILFSIGIEENEKEFSQKYKVKFIVNRLTNIAGKTKIMPENFIIKKI